LRWSGVFPGPAVLPYSMPDHPLVPIPAGYGIAVQRPGTDPAQSFRAWLAQHRPVPVAPD
jgi:hypothetical protein